MLRLIGFFALVFVVLAVLRQVPILGAPFRIPFVGWWFAVIVVSAVCARLASTALERSKLRRLERTFGAVDTPHNQGKLGSLHAGRGRHRAALAGFERASAGEPEFAEWHYRLGISRLATGDPTGARSALERTLALNEDHAYGEAMLRLAEAQTEEGAGEAALATLDRFEQVRGPTPESAYRRGRALRRLGRSGDARAAFAEVGTLARRLAPYQRREGWRWVARAALARFT